MEGEEGGSPSRQQGALEEKGLQGQVMCTQSCPDSWILALLPVLSVSVAVQLLSRV